VIADLLEPLPNGALGNALAELGHGHGGHGCGRSSLMCDPMIRRWRHGPNHT
jgi:hypothetical protein